MPQIPHTDELLIQMLDVLERHNGSQKLSAQSLGIPANTFKHRVKVALMRGLKPSSGNKVEKADRGQCGIPKAIDLSEKPVELTGERSILIMSDIHVPYHDERALDAALNYGIKNSADTIVLNGDIIDCAALSRHEKTPAQRMGFEGELERTRELLSYIRSSFPSAHILYNEGNHEARLPAYLSAHAPELWTLAQLSIPNLLRLPQYRVQWVDTMQLLTAGDLHIIHGHEIRKGGVAAARGTYMEAQRNFVAGHHHRPQEYIHRDISGTVRGGWITGCLCQLSQRWLPVNQWIHGFAHVQLDSDGSFYLQNRKIVNGKVK